MFREGLPALPFLGSGVFSGRVFDFGDADIRPDDFLRWREVLYRGHLQADNPARVFVSDVPIGLIDTRVPDDLGSNARLLRARPFRR